MRYARPALFYTFLAVFAMTAVLTFVGILGIYPIPEQYLNVLFTALLGEVIATVVGLYKAADWFGRGKAAGAVDALAGGWWQMVRAGTENALSFIAVSFSEDEQQLTLVGDAYSLTAAEYARWWSISASVNAATFELHYFWKGDHSGADDDFSGVGFVNFERRAGKQTVDRGMGWFTTGDLERSRLDSRRKTEMIRASPEEIRTMEGGDLAAKRALVRSVQTRWRGATPSGLSPESSTSL